jgi:hypothetical protein
MLYKTLIATYGASLANKSQPLDDPVWHYGWSINLQAFREQTLEALQQAKVYLMDHLAADYADTLHDVLQDDANHANASAITLLDEIVPPAKVTWVEFDYGALVKSRYERGSIWATLHERRVGDGVDHPIGESLRGFLVDDRNADHMRITMFKQSKGSKHVDPLGSLRINRTASGGLNVDDVKLDANLSSTEFRMRYGEDEKAIQARQVIYIADTGYDLFIPHALFAMLVSPDLGGIISVETETFTAKDMKTARKFNKTWVTGAQKSHLTIRIGPHAIAHMRERQARLNFERLPREQRNGTVRHWVSEHERRYQSGKIVLVKRHERGSEPAPNLATRVMGPKDAGSGFVLNPKSTSD